MSLRPLANRMSINDVIQREGDDGILVSSCCQSKMRETKEFHLLSVYECTLCGYGCNAVMKKPTDE